MQHVLKIQLISFVA